MGHVHHIVGKGLEQGACLGEGRRLERERSADDAKILQDVGAVFERDVRVDDDTEHRRFHVACGPGVGRGAPARVHDRGARDEGASMELLGLVQADVEVIELGLELLLVGGRLGEWREGTEEQDVGLWLGEELEARIGLDHLGKAGGDLQLVLHDGAQPRLAKGVEAGVQVQYLRRSRALDTKLAEVGRALADDVVGRFGDGGHRVRAAVQDHPEAHGREERLVRVDRDRVGELDAVEESASAARR